MRAKRQQRRREILRAALRAFRDGGDHATTLGAIAARLGMRKTALYHYFPDKESLLVACHRESLAELDRIVADGRGLESPGARLRHAIAEHVRVMIETLEGSPLALDVSALSAPLQREIITGRDRYEREIRAMVDDGVRRGEFRAADSKMAAFAILGAINWVARWYRPEGGLEAGAIGEQFADLLVGGLETRTRPAPRRRRPGRRTR